MKDARCAAAFAGERHIRPWDTRRVDVPESLSQRALDTWGMAIIEGDYAPGDQIAPGDSLTGVDAPVAVAREAISVLEALGMVAPGHEDSAVVK
ncbi:MAG: hypothetical protein LBJ08_08080, partial [Bifidobacteriaceae bacterium]|nr:hypothetical protein [Bifidobacteriaceae bacterium]